MDLKAPFANASNVEEPSQRDEFLALEGCSLEDGCFGKGECFLSGFGSRQQASVFAGWCPWVLLGSWEPTWIE